MLVDARVHRNDDHEGSPVPAEERCRRLFAKIDGHGVDHAVSITSDRATPDRPRVERVLEVLAEAPRATVVEGLRFPLLGTARITRMTSGRHGSATPPARPSSSTSRWTGRAEGARAWRCA